jgi:hypothetical protein
MLYFTLHKEKSYVVYIFNVIKRSPYSEYKTVNVTVHLTKETKLGSAYWIIRNKNNTQ